MIKVWQCRHLEFQTSVGAATLDGNLTARARGSKSSSQALLAVAWGMVVWCSIVVATGLSAFGKVPGWKSAACGQIATMPVRSAREIGERRSAAPSTGHLDRRTRDRQDRADSPQQASEQQDSGRTSENDSGSKSEKDSESTTEQDSERKSGKNSEGKSGKNSDDEPMVVPQPVENRADGPGGSPLRPSIPSWVEAGSFLDGDDQVEMVIGPPCPSRLIATRELEREIENNARRVLDQWFGAGASERLNLDAEFIRKTLIAEGRFAVVSYDDVETRALRREMGDPQQVFYRGFAQLRYTDEFRERALRRLDELNTHGRLLTLARFGLSAFALVLTGFVFFRLNHATRGFYTTRLLALTVAAFLLLLAFIIGLV